MVMYETKATVEHVRGYFSDVLKQHGWGSYDGFEGNFLALSGVLIGMKDDGNCSIGVFPNEETHSTSIVITKYRVSNEW
jgi:hypothetical protein